MGARVLNGILRTWVNLKSTAMSNYNTDFDAAARPIGGIFVATDRPDAENVLETFSPKPIFGLPSVGNMNEWLERPFAFAEETWESNDVPVSETPGATVLYDINVIPGNFINFKSKNCRYMRCKSFTFTLRANPQPFMNGALRMFWDPSQDDTTELTTMLQIYDYEGVDLDINESKTVSMTIPWLYSHQWVTPATLFKTFGHIKIIPLAALSSGSTATRCHFSVIVNLNGVELAGPTNSQTTSSPSFSARDLESETSVESVAQIQPAAPIHQAAPLTKKLDVAPKMAHEIDFSLKSQLARPFLLKRFNWSTSDAADKGLQTISLHHLPCYSNTTADTPPVTFTYAPLSVHLLRGFRFFRGNIRFSFKFPRTNYHSGSMSVMYDPIELSVYRDGFRTNYTKVINLNSANDDDFSFVVPYNSEFTHLTDEAMGAITFSVFNQLVAPDTVSASIPVLVYMSFEDVTVEYPIPSAPYPLRKLNGSLLESDGFVEDVQPISAQSLSGPDNFKRNNWNDAQELLKIPIPAHRLDGDYTIKVMSTNTAQTHYFANLLFLGSVWCAGDSVIRVIDRTPFTPVSFEISIDGQPPIYFNSRFRPFVDFVVPFMSRLKFNHTKSGEEVTTVQIHPNLLTNRGYEYSIAYSWNNMHFYGRQPIPPIIS